MESNEKAIYLISGPCGTGKSTVARLLASKLNQSILIEGDQLFALFNGRKEPEWGERLAFTWENILSLTKNALANGYDVVIDYIVEEEYDWFCKKVTERGVELNYVILTAEQQVLMERLTSRGDRQLIDRSLFLLNQLKNKEENRPYLLDTSLATPARIVDAILLKRGSTHESQKA